MVYVSTVFFETMSFSMEGARRSEPWNKPRKKPAKAVHRPISVKFLTYF
jgi:hypothetical protein